MPSSKKRKQYAIQELDDFFRDHAASLTSERIIIELEKVATRYELETDDVVVPYLRRRLQETTEETHPELHKYGNNYLRLKFLENHGNAADIFDK